MSAGTRVSIQRQFQAKVGYLEGVNSGLHGNGAWLRFLFHHMHYGAVTACFVVGTVRVDLL